MIVEILNPLLSFLKALMHTISFLRTGLRSPLGPISYHLQYIVAACLNRKRFVGIEPDLQFIFSVIKFHLFTQVPVSGKFDFFIVVLLFHVQQ